jgi:hypothetical protein
MAGAMTRIEPIDLNPQRISFEAHGKPQPAGSKRAFPIRRKGGAIGVAVTDDNPRAKDWQAVVASAAGEAMFRLFEEGDYGATRDLFHGPLGLVVVFTLRRPKGHFGTGRNAGVVKDSAPAKPVVKPDCTKLLRAVEDACTGVVWADDAQVVEQLVSKRYGEPEGAHVQVWKL